jgi:hypothetical protein
VAKLTIEKERKAEFISRVWDPLGAIAAARAAVLWRYMGGDGRWCEQRQGRAEELRFRRLRAGLELYMGRGARCSSYRLFLAGAEERGREQSFTWPARSAPARSSAGGH